MLKQISGIYGACEMHIHAADIMIARRCAGVI